MLVEATREAGIKEIQVCIGRQHNITEQYITIKSIMDLLLEAEIHPGERVVNQWLEHPGIAISRTGG